MGWHRVGQSIMYRKNGKKRGGRPLFTLTFTMRFEHDADKCLLAHCFPFSYSDLVRELEGLEAGVPEEDRCVQTSELCKTIAGNSCPLLTITSPRGTEEEKARRKGIWVSARVHPGESNSSLIMKGILDFLAGSSPEAELLLSLYVFVVVPMLNPDGVINGHYRCNLLGFDLNRQWKDPSEKEHVEIYSAKEVLRAFCAEREVIMFVDIHGHSVKHNVFMYGCDTKYWERNNASGGACPHEQYAERVFPHMMTLTSTTFSLPDSHFVAEKSKERTGRVIAWREFGITNAFTLEASLCGAGDGKRCSAQYTEADLQGMGRAFCLALTMYSSKYLEQEDGMYQAHVQRFLVQVREEEAAAEIAAKDLKVCLPPMCPQP